MNGGEYGSQELQMIETARRLFTEKGFAETTMSDIAAECGVKRPTLHYYFANKDVMFQAVFGTIVESLLPRLQEIMLSELPFIERLGLVVDEYFDRFLENPSIPRFIIGEIQRDVEHLIETARQMHFDKAFSLIRDGLAAEMKAGRLQKVPMYAVFTTFYGAIAFPFLTKNLYVSWFKMSDDNFRDMIWDWKHYVLQQAENILLGGKPVRHMPSRTSINPDITNNL